MMLSLLQTDLPGEWGKCDAVYVAFYWAYSLDKPLWVVCGLYSRRPVVLDPEGSRKSLEAGRSRAARLNPQMSDDWRNQTGSELRVHFQFESIVNKNVRGFKFHFSFYPRSDHPQQLSDGRFNCSEPHMWGRIKRHFLCDLVADCAGSEDEAECPYTTQHCGKGRFSLGNLSDKCFVNAFQASMYGFHAGHFRDCLLS
jgi:hypothetical protein